MPAATHITAVIFDMDGVLTDSEPLINEAAVTMFRERNIGVQPEDFLPFVGTGEDRYIGGVADRYGVSLDLPQAKKRTYEIYLSLVPGKLHAFPGACGLVVACRQAGLSVAVASSADLIKIEANLGKIGLPPAQWDAVISAEDVVNKKPAPAPHESLVSRQPNVRSSRMRSMAFRRPRRPACGAWRWRRLFPPASSLPRS